MSKNRLVVRLAAGCLIAWGGVATAWAAPPTPQYVLGFRPKQDSVQITTPVEAEIASCKVEVAKGANNTSAYVLRDARGQMLRRFADTKGGGKVDTYSYYLDGQEVYREIDTNGNQKADQYRWFGPGGMRWGVDANEDGQIERWVQISAEEVSQEILRAVVTRNITRLQALLPSEQELKALELSAQETNRIRESITKITPKFQETVSKLGALGENTHWLHLETAAPQCLSAEATGGKYDLIGYRSGTIVYEANGKADFVQTGEMIQVRGAWRLIGGPAPGHDMESLGQRTPGQISINDVMKPLIDELGELDKNAPKDGDQVAIVRYNLARAAILERIAATYPKLDDAEQWLRQVADCLSAAAQGNGANIAAYKQLVALRDRVVKAQPGSPLAGYITYREMQVDYANQLRTPPTGEGGLAKIQETCRERLKKFVQDYPNAEDTPDALLTLAMISEFVNKETEAKNYYNFMVTNHGQHPLAAKAAGALRRLNSDGQMFELTGPALGTGQQVNIAQMRGKVVVVYYWASWNQQCAADFFKLKTLLNLYGNKGLELVSVSVDNSADEAQKFITNAQAPGTHLYQPGGLEGPLAVQYGVMVLPDLFLVGRDGKVVSHAVQMSGLEDEIKKLMEK